MKGLEEISKISFKLSQQVREKFPGKDFKSQDGKIYPWISKAEIRFCVVENISELKINPIILLQNSEICHLLHEIESKIGVMMAFGKEGENGLEPYFEKYSTLKSLGDDFRNTQLGDLKNTSKILLFVMDRKQSSVELCRMVAHLSCSIGSRTTGQFDEIHFIHKSIPEISEAFSVIQKGNKNFLYAAFTNTMFLDGFDQQIETTAETHSNNITLHGLVIFTTYENLLKMNGLY